MSPTIKIVPWEISRFRCTIVFDKHFALLPPPVDGQRNGDPPEPFVAGIGGTPESALKNALEELGRSLVRCMARGESKLVEMIS